MYLTMCGEEPGTVDDNLKNSSGLFGIMQRGVSGLKLGALTQADRAFLHPEVLEHYVAALERFEKLGATIVEFELPRSIDDMREGVATLIGTEGYYHHGTAYEDPANQMDSDVKARIMEGKSVSAQDYIRAQRTRLDDRANFLAAMKGFSAIASRL